MGYFRKRPIIIEAHRWYPENTNLGVALTKYAYADVICGKCGESMMSHGVVETLEGEMTACPGDWIITGIKGEKYPINAAVFEETYDAVLE